MSIRSCRRCRSIIVASVGFCQGPRLAFPYFLGNCACIPPLLFLLVTPHYCICYLPRMETFSTDLLFFALLSLGSPLYFLVAPTYTRDLRTIV